MQNLSIQRWSSKDSPDYAGCVQPADRTWILYVRRDGGAPELHTGRDPKTPALPMREGADKR